MNGCGDGPERSVVRRPAREISQTGLIVDDFRRPTHRGPAAPQSLLTLDGWPGLSRRKKYGAAPEGAAPLLSR